MTNGLTDIDFGVWSRSREWPLAAVDARRGRKRTVKVWTTTTTEIDIEIPARRMVIGQKQQQQQQEITDIVKSVLLRRRRWYKLCHLLHVSTI